MSNITVRNNTLGTIETFDAWMRGALAFAERDIAATEAARERNLAAAIARGTCAVGHDLTLPEIPINSLGTHPCGYCTNAREAMP